MPSRSATRRLLLPFPRVAATVAIVVDRYLGFAVLSWLIASCVGVAIWLNAFKRNELLGNAVCGFAAWDWRGHHHPGATTMLSTTLATSRAWNRDSCGMRGTLDDEPTVYRAKNDNALISRPQGDYTSAVLKVNAIESGSMWVEALPVKHDCRLLEL